VLFFALLLASQSGYAQTEVSGGQTGTNKDRYIINDDESNHDAALRLQSKDGPWFNDWMLYNENGDGNLHISNWVGTSHSKANEDDIGNRYFTFANAGVPGDAYSGAFGINVVPLSGLDINFGTARTGSHASNRPMYITGNIGSSYNGIEFRHLSGTQGIGFGYNTIYATGTNTNQELNFQSRGTGNINLRTGTSSDLFINGSSGNVGIGTTNAAHKLHVAGPMFAEKYVVQNGQDGGLNRGIFMWTKDNPDWGMYMASAGFAKAFNGGTAVAGHNFNSHSIRFRVYNNSNRGFIWENSSNQNLMSLNGSTGDMKVKGTLDVGGLTINGITAGPANFGNLSNHSTYKDFNTTVTNWGWSYVEGSTNAPNNLSSQWYRNITSLGKQYNINSYRLEVAYPRFNTASAGVWMRTMESGTLTNWTRISPGAGGTSTNPIDDVLKYDIVVDHISATIDTRFSQDVLM
jgi:hypothetical protein